LDNISKGYFLALSLERASSWLSRFSIQWGTGGLSLSSGKYLADSGNRTQSSRKESSKDDVPDRHETLLSLPDISPIRIRGDYIVSFLFKFFITNLIFNA
jgi:hypothetical protein